MNDLFLIEKSRVGFGRCSTDGLGYSAYGDGRVIARRDISDYYTISAHAPSVVEIDLLKPAEVVGLMNCSSWLNRSHATEFWIDHNYLGVAYGPGEETAPIILPAGKHTLKTVILNDGSLVGHSRHTVWLLRPSAASPQNGAASDVALVTISNGTTDATCTRMHLLAYSARKQGAWLHVFGQGEEKYPGWYELKIVQLKKWIQSLPARHRYIAYVDGWDAALVTGLDEVREKFLAFNSPIVAGTEGGHGWPVTHPAWLARFPEAQKGRRFVQAGTWMGEREAIVSALDVMAALYEQYDPPSPPNTLLYEGDEANSPDQAWAHRWARGDDQFLWNCARLLKRIEPAMDFEAKIFSNLFADDTRFVGGSYEFRGSRLRDKRTGHEPCILHFPGGGKGYMHHWIGRLGLCDDTFRPNGAARDQ